MSCEDEEILTAYADGRCAPAERERVSAHLQSCADCRGQLRWLGAMKASLASLPAPRAPRELTDSLRRQARLAAGRKRARRRRERWQAWTAWGSTGRAAGLGLAAGLAAAAVAVMLRVGEPSETVSLDDMLAAHRAYALTMPLTSQETVMSGLADALAGEGP